MRKCNATVALGGAALLLLLQSRGLLLLLSFLNFLVLPFFQLMVTAFSGFLSLHLLLLLLSLSLSASMHYLFSLLWQQHASLFWSWYV